MLVIRAGVLVALIAVMPGVAVAQGITTAFAPVNGFVDISGTGTPILGVGDDSEHVINTTIGNLLFPAGQVLVSSNGVIVSNCPGGTVAFTNQSIGTGVPTGLPGLGDGHVAAFWDDLIPINGNGSNTIFWQEIGNTLYVTWNNIGRFGASGVATEVITFQIQVLADPGSCDPAIQILYPDTTFGGSGASQDAGAQATVGYATRLFGAANVPWSFDMMNAVPSGTVLSIEFFGSALSASSPLGSGSLQINYGNSACVATGANLDYFFLVTLSAPSVQDLNLFGLSIPFIQLANEIATGFPFTGTLDGAGDFQYGPFEGLPALTLRALVIEFDAMGDRTNHSNVLTYTVP